MLPHFHIISGTYLNNYFSHKNYLQSKVCSSSPLHEWCMFFDFLLNLFFFFLQCTIKYLIHRKSVLALKSRSKLSIHSCNLTIQYLQLFSYQRASRTLIKDTKLKLRPDSNVFRLTSLCNALHFSLGLY